MQDMITQLKSYLRSIWRHRWPLIATVWFVCVAGWVVVYKLPDQYEASARVYVDTQSMLKPLLKGLAADTSMRQQVSLITRTLLSRPNLEKVTRMTDMDLKARTPEEMENMLEGLRQNIRIESTGRVDLYTIKYQNSDPDQAKRVVQSLLTIFVESSLGESRKDTDVAQRFLNEQVREYESRLIAAEERIKEFKRKNVGLMPSEGKDYYERLQQANAQLSQTELALEEARKRRDELQRQLEGEEPTFGITGQSQFTSSLDKRIESLEGRLDSLLLQYTEKHPDVQALKRTIKQLKEQRQEQMQMLANDPAFGSTNTSPVYQQLRIELGKAEAEVAKLKARYREHQKRVEKLQKLVDTVPQVEAELAQLNRDYEINKKNYEALLSRLESAKLAEQAEQRVDNIQFRIIDPPRVPPTPAAPNRPLYMSVVLFAGIGAGIALAILLAQIRMTFDNRRDLSEAMGIPVLGSVSVVWTRDLLLKRRLGTASFMLASLALIGVYSGLMIWQLADANVIARITDLIGSGI